MTSDFKKRVEERAEKLSYEAAKPMLRDMYPSRSRGQMKNEFRHFIILGAEIADQLWRERIEATIDGDHIYESSTEPYRTVGEVYEFNAGRESLRRELLNEEEKR